VSERKLGVLMMAYGGPQSLDEIPGYLADIRRGRPTPPEVRAEITNNYRLIGGRSPLLEITRKQAQAVAAHFPAGDLRFFLGMRHWSPWIEETIGRMVESGITHAVSLVLAPHYSKLSIAKYQGKIQAGLEMFRGEIEFAHIDSYHTAPGLIAAFARRVHAGLSQWPPAQRQRVHVVFSAHSLPVRILNNGDPYVDQLHQTASLIAQKAGLSPGQWSWSFQSAGRSQEPWLGPQLPEYLPSLAQRDILDVISIPIGFVSDHVEILFDIDIQAQEVARTLGMRLVRPPALNDDPLFVDTVVQVIRQRIRQKGWWD